MASYDCVVSVTTEYGTFQYGINKGKDGLYSVYFTKSDEFRGARNTREKAIELAKQQVKGTIRSVDIK